MGVRFIHTSDWQLGMTRHFLSDQAQALYAQDQIEGIVQLGRLAADRCCDFVLVAGDVYETAQPPRAVLSRSLEAMASIAAPVYLLPGNHDPFNSSSLWTGSHFRDHAPPNVHVLENSSPRQVAGTSARLVAAPLVSKKPSNDLVASAIEQLRSLSELPEPGSFTIVVGHGQIDALGFGSPSDGPMQDSGRLSLSVIEEAISQGFCHYVALGDRHSTTQLGTGPIGAASKIWYSGALLATNFDEVEVESNCALVVDIADDGAVCVEQVEVGKWSFIAEHRSISSSEDIELLGEWLGSLEDKSRTAIKLALIGTVNMSGRARLNEILEYHRDLFASLEESERRTDLVVLADDADLGDLGLTGFARSALDELCEMAVNETSGADKPDHSVATDALMLLHRLARSAS